MTGPELKAIRQRLKLTQEVFAFALGSNAKPANAGAWIRDLETGKQNIPATLARCVWLLDKRKSVPAHFYERES